MSSREIVALRTERRRLLANSRERQRVNKMNGMYQKLLSMLMIAGRSGGKVSRVQILREASAYIQRLQAYLSLPDPNLINAQILFPRAFHSQHDNQLITYQRTIAPNDTVITTFPTN